MQVVDADRLEPLLDLEATDPEFYHRIQTVIVETGVAQTARDGASRRFAPQFKPGQVRYLHEIAASPLRIRQVREVENGAATMNLAIRKECESDHRAVEELTREAFWNLFVPGCDEHYLVHRMWSHPDFLADLALVAVLDEVIVGSILYTRSRVVGDCGEEIPTLTFGPVGVLPEHQRKGIGSALIRHSVRLATESGHAAILIHGYPGNYCRHGFRSSKNLGIGDGAGKYPYSLLALELQKGIFAGRHWRFLPSEVYDLDADAAGEFDQGFPARAKEYRHTQEEFSIACRAYLE